MFDINKAGFDAFILIVGVLLAAPMLTAVWMLTKPVTLIRKTRRYVSRHLLPGIGREEFAKLVALDAESDALYSKIVICKQKISIATRRKTRSQNRPEIEAEFNILDDQLRWLEDELAFLHSIQSSVQIGKDLIVINARVSSILPGGMADEVHALNRRMEAKVLARERLALKQFADFPESEQLEEEVSDLGDSAVHSKTARTGLDKSLSGVSAADPSINRAFLSLLARSRWSTNMLVDAVRKENELEKYLAELTASSCLGGEVNDSVETVSNYLKSISRRNFIIDQRLFFIEEIMHRLFVIKILLSYLPRKKTSELQNYCELTHTIEKFLGTLTSTDEPAAEFDSILICSRMLKLEESCLMAFIQIAKGQNNLDPASIAWFITNMKSARASLESKLLEVVEEREKWESVSAEMNNGGKLFAASFAEHRRDRYMNEVQLIVKGVDIVDIVIFSVTKRSRN